MVQSTRKRKVSSVAVIFHFEKFAPKRINMILSLGATFHLKDFYSNKNSYAILSLVAKRPDDSAYVQFILRKVLLV